MQTRTQPFVMESRAQRKDVNCDPRSMRRKLPPREYPDSDSTDRSVSADVLRQEPEEPDGREEDDDDHEGDSDGYSE
jgi:hypothetical protein